MADILLTHSNHLYYDRKQVRKMQPYPPLQTLLAAACLRRQGYSVALFDPSLEAPQPGFEQALERHKPRLVAVCEDNFNYLTKMCLLRNREVACWMASTCREAGIPAIVNGSDSADRAAEYLAAGFRYVIRGEVEEAIVETAAMLLDGTGSAAQIHGLIFHDPHTGALRHTPRRAPLADLDSLPMPAWDLVDAEPYRAAWKSTHDYFSMNVVSSRGCPYKCNWCAKPIWGDSYHCRSPRLVAEELRVMKDRFAPDHIWLADDIFALSQHWTHEFADAVEALDARIPFKMQSRPDLMTRETVDDLRRSGCDEVWMGVESGSQDILDAMDKGTRIWQVFEARENLRRHGIRVGFFVQFGYPGETWKEIEKTIELVRNTRPDDIGVSVSYPLPGTTFHQMVSSQLGAKENWSDSDDLDMMFQGAFTSDLYRALADALHLEVRQGREEAADAWSKVLALRETCARKMPIWISC
jgi:anaerobic magnesium-protoporphyrin IX monomethyl ester cyclase